MIKVFQKIQIRIAVIAREERPRHQTAGSPFCHAKRPEGLGAGAERQSLKSDENPSRLLRRKLLAMTEFYHIEIQP